MINYLSNTPEIYLDGTSSTVYNICLQERPKIPSPQRLQTVNDNPFSQRGSFRSNSGWGDINIKVKFNYLEDISVSGVSFRMAFAKIRSVLFNTKKIDFNDEVNAYYVVKTVDIDDAENDIIEYGSFDVTFTCSPFAYLNDDDDPIEYEFRKTDTSPINTKRVLYLENDGFYDCFPTVTIKYEGANVNADLPALTLQPTRQDNEISTDPDYIWSFKLLRWKTGYDLVVDSEKTLVYWKQETASSIDILDASSDVDMKTFPQMRLGEAQLVTSALTSARYQYTVQFERNRVI